MDKARLTIDVEQAGVIEDALTYYLEASSDNFGAGYGDEDIEARRQILHERALVVAFLSRVEAARRRMSGPQEFKDITDEVDALLGREVADAD